MPTILWKFLCSSINHILKLRIFEIISIQYKYYTPKTTFHCMY